LSEPLRIVVVDDAPEVRTVLTAELRADGGFDVVGQGGNGLEAIDLASRLAPDLVLLDVSMPDMDGLDALVAIRVAAPATKVVMLSGFAADELADRAQELGATAFLHKDLPTEELPDVLRSLASPPPARTSTSPATPAPASHVDAASEVMAEQVERFRDMFDQATIGMATLTLGGKIVRANPALVRLTGASAAALTGRAYADLASTASATAVDAAIADVVSGRRDVADLEHRLGVEHGERWVLSTVAAVRDSSGRPLYLFLQVQDVTSRHEAQEALGISEAQLRLLVEGVAEYAIFMLDPEGHIASWNAGAQRIKGWTASEVLGQHFRLFYTQADRDRRHPEHELEIAAAEGRYEEEGVRVRKDGSTFWASVVITALRGTSGDLVGFGKVTRDVTGRVEARQRLEANAAAQAEFLAVTAHELRSPIMAVSNGARLLRKSWSAMADEDRDALLDALESSSTRLRRLVEDLLTASRLEAGVVALDLAPFDLAPLVQEVVGAAIDVPVEVDVDDGVRVHGDRGRIGQMLTNLVRNASQHGEPPVELRAERSPDGTTVRIDVRDHGLGVSPAARGDLFAKYSTAGGRRAGNGLGLYITRELARQQGGDAWYEDAAPGARFVLRLPAG